MPDQEQKEIQAKAVMDFANMHVGAFDSGFVEGNTLTVYDVHRSAQNYVNDTFDFTAKSLAEQWGNDTAIECRETPRHEQLKKLLSEFDRYSQNNSEYMGSPFRKRILDAITQK